jgi:hypothetical protein
VWFRADYLLWWTKDGPISTPLLTTGSPSATIIGGLTQPGTQVLFGQSPLDYGTTSGMRLDAGGWLDAERTWGVDGSIFFLERHAAGFGASSDANGNPVLAQPLVDPATGQEFTEVISLPGLMAGRVAISSRSRLRGWELNGLANAVRGDHFNLDLLAGFRTVTLDEDLQDVSVLTPLVSQFLTFQGAAVNPPNTVTTFDGFTAHNHFYGVQVGGLASWELGDLTLGATGKIAVGSSQELVQVSGISALITPTGTTTTAPGGVLAVPGNIGRHFHDAFAVVPELGLQVSYRVTAHLEARVGYTFLYWSDVARPGNQVNRAVAPGLIPTDPLFGSANATRPAFQFHASEYWAQGLTFGLALRF